MRLTYKQKQFIRKQWKQSSIENIARELRVDPDVVDRYTKKDLRDNPTGQREVKQSYSFDTKIFTNFSNFFVENLPFLLVLTVIVIATYANSFFNQFVSDDIPVILKRPGVIGNLQYVFSDPIDFFRPLLYLIAFKIGGMNPLFFRLINVFFHLGVVWLSYITIYYFSNRPIAFLSAAILAIHPAISEAIVWISGGTYAQYSFFILASFIAYLAFRIRNRYYFASLLLFIIALTSNYRSAWVLPLVITLFELTFGRLTQAWKRLAPYYFIVGIWFLLAFGRLGARIGGMQEDYYQTGGFHNPLIQIPVSLTSYFQLFIWPDKLTLYHSELQFSILEYSIRTVIVVLFFSSIIVAYFKNKRIFFWLVFFIILLLPTLTPLKVAWVVAERYVYLASLGVFFTVSYLLFLFLRKYKQEQLLYVVASVLIIVFSVRTAIRNNDWKNEDTLWFATSKTSPSDPKTHNNLGDVYFRHKNFPAAIKEFSLAAKLNPKYADAYHNLGNAYYQNGNLEEAQKSYERALAINPSIWQSYQAIGIIYFDRKDFIKTEKYLIKALQLSPNNPQIYYNLGIIYYQMSRKEDARKSLQKALDLDPGNTQIKKALSQL